MVIETTIALILIFGVLVIAHEWGHFVAARLAGIRVEEFALGFGPKLLRLFKLGDTEYTLHPFPVGGFVKLAGMEPGQENVPDGFQAKPALARALVIFAGPFMSFVLAALVFVFVGLFWGFPEDGTTSKALQVFPQTVAQKIGLRAGDTIVSIDGKRITRGEQMTDIIHSRPGQKLTLRVQRNGRTFTRVAAPSWEIVYLDARWSFVDPQVGVATQVVDSGAAAKAGVRDRDVLVSVNGQAITSGKQMTDIIKASGPERVRLVLKRGGRRVVVRAIPPVQLVRYAGTDWRFGPNGGYADLKGESDKATGLRRYDEIVKINGKKIKTGRQMLDALSAPCKDGVNITVKRDDKAVRLKPVPASSCAGVQSEVYTAIGLFGFAPAPVLAKKGFTDSITTGLMRTFGMLKAVLAALAPSEIGENVGGPVMIAKQTSSMVALGLYYVISMAGALSMSLAVINLVPIPAVLDGGHILLIGIEAIRRKRFTIEQMAKLQMIGLAMVGILIVAVLWSDILKLSTGQVPQ